MSRWQRTAWLEYYHYLYHPAQQRDGEQSQAHRGERAVLVAAALTGDSATRRETQSSYHVMRYQCRQWYCHWHATRRQHQAQAHSQTGRPRRQLARASSTLPRQLLLMVVSASLWQ